MFLELSWKQYYWAASSASNNGIFCRHLFNLLFIVAYK